MPNRFTWNPVPGNQVQPANLALKEELLSQQPASSIPAPVIDLWMSPGA
jgi:hypothetical protein